MDNSELIEQLKSDLEDLFKQRDKNHIEGLIRSIARAISRLTVEGDQNLRLKKIATDFTSLYTNQVKYWELRDKAEYPGLRVKQEFDQSFFDALAILKEELYALLKQL